MQSFWRKYMYTIGEVWEVWKNRSTRLYTKCSWSREIEHLIPWQQFGYGECVCNIKTNLSSTSWPPWLFESHPLSSYIEHFLYKVYKSLQKVKWPFDFWYRLYFLWLLGNFYILNIRANECVQFYWHWYSSMSPSWLLSIFFYCW